MIRSTIKEHQRKEKIWTNINGNNKKGGASKKIKINFNYKDKEDR